MSRDVAKGKRARRLVINALTLTSGFGKSLAEWQLGTAGPSAASGHALCVCLYNLYNLYNHSKRANSV